MDKTLIKNNFVFETKHQNIEKTIAMEIKSHCYDDGKGLYCIVLIVKNNDEEVLRLFGDEAIDFIIYLHTEL